MKKRVVKKSGHRMKELGYKAVVVWFELEQLDAVKEAAGELYQKVAAFVRQAALNRVTDVRRSRFSR